MPRQRDASPVRFKYQDIGPAKFKWNDLKEQIQSLDLGSKVEANLIKHGKFGHLFLFMLIFKGICTPEDPLVWDDLYSKKRCLPYLRVAVCVVLYENIEPTHPFYDKLSRAFE